MDFLPGDVTVERAALSCLRDAAISGAVLVSVTGAYAGAGIQYFIPCSLVFLARKKLNHLRKEFNLELRNPLESYFRHLGFIVMIVVWSGGAVGLVTANFVLRAIK